MKSSIRFHLLLVLTIASAACEGGDSGKPDNQNVNPGCNPLGLGHCLTPFPSSFYLKEDAASATGYRVSIPEGVLPKNKSSVAVDPAPYNRLDGFSAAAPYIVYYPAGVDQSDLTFHTEVEKSVTSESSTVILDMDSGERIPHFAEMDARAKTDKGEKQALIIRPLRRLKSGGHYALAITDALKGAGGSELEVPPAFSVLRDGTPSRDERVEAMRTGYEKVFDALGKAGIQRSRLRLAWDVVTSSDEILISDMLFGIDRALAAATVDEMDYTIKTVEEDFSPDILRHVSGTFRAPLLLTEEGSIYGLLQRDADGKPEVLGYYDISFEMVIPRSALTDAPLPPLYYGHGFLGSARNEIVEPSGNHVQTFAEQYGAVVFGTDWVGMTRKDAANVASVLTNLNKFPLIPERLIQGMVNAMVLWRTIREKIRLDPALEVNGQPAVSDAVPDFYGNSQGGILGGIFMAFEPQITRGILGVAGGNWSIMIERSVNWPPLEAVYKLSYKDKLDREVLLALMQARWDAADPITTAPGLLAGGVPGRPPKSILMIEAVGDTQVPNLATEMFSRSAGIPLLIPSPRQIFGLDTSEGPLSSALLVVDEKPADMPPQTNEPSSSSNGTHDSVRTRQPVINAMAEFLRAGQISNPCDGPCDPE